MIGFGFGVFLGAIVVTVDRVLQIFFRPSCGCWWLVCVRCHVANCDMVIFRGAFWWSALGLVFFTVHCGHWWQGVCLVFYRPSCSCWWLGLSLMWCGWSWCGCFSGCILVVGDWVCIWCCVADHDIHLEVPRVWWSRFQAMDHEGQYENIHYQYCSVKICILLVITGS